MTPNLNIQKILSDRLVDVGHLAQEAKEALDNADTNPRMKIVREKLNDILELALPPDIDLQHQFGKTNPEESQK